MSAVDWWFTPGVGKPLVTSAARRAGEHEDAVEMAGEVEVAAVILEWDLRFVVVLLGG